MSNGSEGPITEMTETMWNTVKNCSWKDGGFNDGGTLKFLWPTANGVDFKSWFEFASTKSLLLKLYMSQSTFNTLKSYTFNSNLKCFDDASGNHYRLKWEKSGSDYWVVTRQVTL